MRVDLTASNKNRSNAYQVASGLGNLRELQLDQTRHIGYPIIFFGILGYFYYFGKFGGSYVIYYFCYQFIQK